MSNQFHTLKVLAIDHPIREATTITFDVPEHLRDAFAYFPGQHLIMRFFLEGKEVRRSYSLHSSPFLDEPLQVTVKRVTNGLVSNFIADHLKTGDEIEVMIPQGRFYADIQTDAYKTYFLFAAGSGITPIFSILKSVLLASPNCVVNLFYGNTHQNSIIFKNELDEFKKRYADRLRIVHTLSDPNIWSTWEQWKGRRGRIDSPSVEWFITNYPPVAQRTEYYICGPDSMNICVRNALIQLQIPKEIIYMEQFAGTRENLKSIRKAAENACLFATLNGHTYQFRVPKGKTILQVLKEENTNPPYSCESGVCATCAAKVTMGEVEMKTCIALDEDEIKKGMILTCQALPITDEIKIELLK